MPNYKYLIQCRRKQNCIGGLNYGLESGSNERARAACVVSEH